MPGDERDDIGSPNDGRGQGKPPLGLRCPGCGYAKCQNKRLECGGEWLEDE